MHADLLAVEEALLGHEAVRVFGVEILPDPQDLLLGHLVLPVHRLHTGMVGKIAHTRQILSSISPKQHLLLLLPVPSSLLFSEPQSLVSSVPFSLKAFFLTFSILVLMLLPCPVLCSLADHPPGTGLYK